MGKWSNRLVQEDLCAGRLDEIMADDIQRSCRNRRIFFDHITEKRAKSQCSPGIFHNLCS